MNSVLRIKFILICLIYNFSYSQGSVESDELSKNRERSVAFGFNLYKPVPTGENFFADSASGTIGFDFNFQVFVYKQIFIGLSLGDSYFDNEDISFSGNYSKVTLSSQELFIGYEYLFNKDFRIGASITLIGDSRYRNNQSTTNNVYQIDKATLRKYQIYFGYDVDRTVTFYLNYAYRNDKTKIQTAPEISADFDRIDFHNIGVGIKLYLGQKAIF